MSNLKKITLLLAFILFISCGSGDNGFDTYDGKALSEWQMIGIGSVEVTSNGDLNLTEGRNQREWCSFHRKPTAKKWNLLSM